ncbi:MAG: Phospholipase D/Transphosphatidylase [Candidatus Nomurabacteria bacterium GW2011_GWB1_37_5]|uniref:Phospholipase D/Transphosphatidylase n=1 Tax=Candidatus Nomurabacteria bacterium GW2011_GWB1_37_5 TaxID=1618742 RepID=A0A0G0H7K3_9BACT|nr:MAG: Phospholipase D/Transphosphatidylase [Candidatus Nomurabacteria bacterium GW2011_GWB1_37_5]
MKLKNKQLRTYQSGNKVTFTKGGKEYFDALLRIINNAKNIIHLHTYILVADETGRMVVGALMDAVKRGVQVYLLIDAYGSRGLSRGFVSEIINSGINFRYFAPLISSEGLHLGRRLHQKIIVADFETALIGGINIADRYRGVGEQKPWLDFSILINGNICNEISIICSRFWKRKFITKKIRVQKRIGSDYPMIRIRRNDWMRRKSQISKSYKEAFTAAEKSITIVGAYFLPSRRLRKLIKSAIRRGVSVKIIISQKSDELVFGLAMDYLYGWLFKNGAQIYEYCPSVVHGKAAVVDNKWLTIGSHDLNFLSTYGLIETNVDVLDNDMAVEFNQYLEKIIDNDCRKITIEKFQKKWMFQGLLSWLAYYFMRISQWLVVFLTRKGVDYE